MISGAHEGVPIEDYHAAPYVSGSKLQTFVDRGARGYWMRYLSGAVTERSREWGEVGHAFEDALRGKEPLYLEETPDDLRSADGGMRSKAARTWVAEQQAWAEQKRSEGFAVLDPKWREMMRFGVENLRDNPTARSLMEACAEQVTIRAEYPGLPGVQSRPDWFALSGPYGGPIAPDLKTVSSLRAFRSQVYRLGYHRTAAICDLTCTSLHVPVGDVSHPRIVVEKEPPYRCCVFWLRDEYMRVAHEEAARYLGELAYCYESGIWPAIESDVDLYPPAYAGAYFESADDMEEP